MKKNILIYIIIFCVSNCFAQETVKKKNRLTGTVVEVFNVLKSDKVIKQGLYQAIYKNGIPLASGEYAGNKRINVWHFYNTYGKLVENFDYNKNSLLYEARDDSLSRGKIAYAFDEKINDTDKVTKPIKPGGESYGYIPYLRIFRLPDSLNDVPSERIAGMLELLVSPFGRLADFKVHIKIDYYESETTFSPDIIDEADRIFIPATLNNGPILSRIFVKCRVNDFGELDID